MNSTLQKPQLFSLDRLLPLFQLIACGFLLVFVCSTTATAESSSEPTPISWTAYKNSRAGIFYRPSDFYRLGLKKSFPEMEVINSEKIPLLGTMARHLEKAGVPVLFGFDSNVEATFDLYGMVLNMSPFMPPENIGTTPRSALGRLYIGEHDTGHHFAGIPGLRKTDLANLEVTREKLKRLIILKESFAVTQSSMVFMPEYSEWRDRSLLKAEKIENYRKYNQGYYTGLKPLTPAEHVDLSESWTQGKLEHYDELLKQFTSSKSLRETREAGAVPIMPNFSKLIGQKGSDALLSFIVKTFEAKLSMKRKVGYHGFVEYSTMLSDFYLQPWLVEWSDDFQIGIPIDDLVKRTQNLLDQAREGKIRNITDPDTGNERDFGWEQAFLKTEIALFGRRVKEMQVVCERDGCLIADAGENLSQLYAKAKSLHRKIEKDSDLQEVKEKFLELVELAEKRVSPNKTVYFSSRAAGVIFSDYWRNPYAYLVSRGRLYGSHFSPSEVLSATEKAPVKRSPFQLWIENIKKKFAPGFEASLERRNLKEELGKRYYESLEAAKHPNFTGDESLALSAQLHEFKHNLRTLILKSLLPQFSELAPFDSQSKLKLERSLREWLSLAESKLDEASHANQTPSIEWWRALDTPLNRIHEKWLLNSSEVTESDLEALNEQVRKSVLELGHFPINSKSSRTDFNSALFRAISPPGYASFHESLLFIDFIDPEIDSKTRLPSRALARPYLSFQEWISKEAVIGCMKYLKQPETGLEP